MKIIMMSEVYEWSLAYRVWAREGKEGRGAMLD